MPAHTDWPSDYQARFWNEYPRRVAKLTAMRALEKVRKSGEVPFERLISAVREYAVSVATTDMKFVAHPATWLNAGRWDDEPQALGNNHERNRTMRHVWDDLFAEASDGTGTHSYRVLPN